MNLPGLPLLFLACVGSLGGLLASAPARAADDDAATDTRPAPIPTPPFGDLRTWYNGVDSIRVPPRFQPLQEPGNRSLIPPRTDRSPLQARLGAALEADDNLLLASRRPRGGTALIASPGVNWRDEGRRHRVEVDGSADLLRGVAGAYDASRVDAATVQGSALYRSSETTVLNYLGTSLRSHDPAGNSGSAPVPGATADQRYASLYQRHEVGFGWRTGPSTDVSARHVGTRASSRSPGYVRTRAADLEVGGRWRKDAKQRYGATVRKRSARFNGRPRASTHAAWLEAERQHSPTLVMRAAVGSAQGQGLSLTLWRAGLTQTFANGQWDLAFERDVSVPAGLGRLYELRSARIGVVWRVGASGRLEVSLIGSEYRPLGGTPDAIGAVRTWRPRLAYTLPLDEHWWLNLRYQGIDDTLIDTPLRTRGNRLIVTVLRTF